MLSMEPFDDTRLILQQPTSNFSSTTAKKARKLSDDLYSAYLLATAQNQKTIPTIIETPEARRGTIFSEKRYEENPALDSSFVGNFIQKK